MRRAHVGGLLIAAVLLGACSACSSTQKLNPFASNDGKNRPTELQPFTPSAELALRWQSNVGSAGSAHVFTPAVVGDSVYAAARDGAVQRIDGGRTVWRIGLNQPISGGVGSDGKRVAVGTEKGEVIVLDAADGHELWRARASSEVLAAPVLGEGLVIARSGDARIFGFDANDGKRRWVYQRSTPALSLRTNVGIMLTGRLILAGFPGGKLVAISSGNGAAVWEGTVALPKGATELERVTDVTSTAAVGDGIACAVAFQGRVACFDLNDGHLLWSRDMSSMAGLDIDNRYVYVVDDKGIVYALDRSSGSSVWKQDKLYLRGPSRPVSLGSQIALADYQGVVHLLLREDGALAARFTTDGSRAIAAPQRQGENGFVVQTAQGGVFALEKR